MRDLIRQLREMAQTADAPEMVKRLAAMEAWLCQPAAHVVVCGEFKRGKSTLVNALLGADICATDVLPATAIPAVLRYADSPRAVIRHRDGTKERIEPEALSSLSVGSSRDLEKIRLVEVGWPSPLLRQGLVLIDTPGVNDLSRQRAEVTYGFLPLADAALLVLDATSPLTRSETEFLTEHLLPAVVDRLIFVLGKTDRLDADELEEAVDGARSRLRAVLERDDVDVLPLSALNAQRGDDEELTDVRAAIQRVQETAGGHRARLARQRLTSAAATLLDEVDQAIAASQLSETELTDVRLGFEETRQSLLEQFEGFRDYIDLYGRKTLTELIHKSLGTLEKELTEDVLHRLEGFGGSAVERYVKQEVPHQMSKALRKWTDSRSREIQRFLEKFVARVSEDYAHAFTAPLDMSALPVKLAAPDLVLIKEEVATSRTRELLEGRLLPQAGGVAAGLLLVSHPIGMVLGMMAGTFLSSQMAEQTTERRKEEARALLGEKIPDTFAGFRGALTTSVDGWFDQLTELLRGGLDDAVARSQRRLSDAGRDRVAPLEAQRDAIVAFQGRLEDHDTERVT